MVNGYIEAQGILHHVHELLRHARPEECKINDGESEFHTIDGNHRDYVRNHSYPMQPTILLLFLNII